MVVAVVARPVAAAVAVAVGSAAGQDSAVLMAGSEARESAAAAVGGAAAVGVEAEAAVPRQARTVGNEACVTLHACPKPQRMPQFPPSPSTLGEGREEGSSSSGVRCIA